MSPPTPPRPTVLVIGAGAAGLCAAGRLADVADVVVVDKARGVGGRMATRRIADATFDHGAQFLTTRDAAFRDFVDSLAALGVVAPWFTGSVGPRGVEAPSADGHVRWRGAHGMAGIAKHLAAGLDVRCGRRVTSIADADGAWSVLIDAVGADEQEVRADGVVITAPVPQALELLGSGGVVLSPGDADALSAISYDPCLAVLAPLDEPWCIAAPGAMRPEGPVLAWAAENALKGVSQRSALTLHASTSASRSMWSSPDAEVAAALLAAAADVMDGIEPVVDMAAVQVQRWRYSIPTEPFPDPCLEAEGLPPLVFAGDAFGGPRVEGAVRSGWSAAEALGQRLARG